MRIGDLRHRISIEAPTDTADGMGGQTRTWASVAENVPAAIWPTSANETIQAAQQTMTVTHRIRIRWRSGILSSYRVKFGERYFAIVSLITPNEVHRVIDMLVKEAI